MRNIILLVLGAFLEVFSVPVIVGTLILAVVVGLGYGLHLVHPGFIFLANMQLGYLTLPVGSDLFIASYRFDHPIDDIYQTRMPFLLDLLIAVLMISSALYSIIKITPNHNPFSNGVAAAQLQRQVAFY